LARSAAISKATLQRAKTELHVHCRKLSGTGHWIWALPNADVTPLDPDKGLDLGPEMVVCPRSPVVATEGDNPPHQTHDDANDNDVAKDADDEMVEKDEFVPVRLADPVAAELRHGTGHREPVSLRAKHEMVEKDEFVPVRLAQPVAAELGPGTGRREPVTLRAMDEKHEKDDFQPPTALPPPAVLASSSPDNADLRSPP
jgi:hypothetical protein